jgi:predicted MPP superfamily phosphohydrolase
MKLFLLFFLVVYGSGHLYFYSRFTRAFSPARRWRRVIATVLLLTTMTPLLVRLAERHDHLLLATALAYPGYFWMAVLFLFLVLSLSWDVASALLFCRAPWRQRRRLGNVTPHRHQFVFCLGVAMTCSLYGIYEADTIRTEQISIRTAKGANIAAPIRIVQISDVHLGILMRDRKIKKIGDLIRAARPDMLVSTGDLIDGNLTQDGAMTNYLQQLRPPLGAYAVLGNHEYYVGREPSIEIMRQAGFTVLRGETRTVGPITIAGADDITALRRDHYRSIPPIQPAAFTLLLKHQPRVTTETPFDLQLSGHIHQGQIFPFQVLTWLRFKVHCGLTQLNDGRYLYVSRGTGTWGPPVRFLAPPEITVIDLLPPTE